MWPGYNHSIKIIPFLRDYLIELFYNNFLSHIQMLIAQRYAESIYGLTIISCKKIFLWYLMQLLFLNGEDRYK